jgi:hypothetical protein
MIISAASLRPQTVLIDLIIKSVAEHLLQLNYSIKKNLALMIP